LDLLVDMRTLGELVAITEDPQGCVDPEDDKFIETARLGRAGFLVTSDRHLLSMTISGLVILEAPAFLSGVP
jgi:predicted nucleic acid-binding protein